MPGHKPTDTVVEGTIATPTTHPGMTVDYAVRASAQGPWSNELAITYPEQSEPEETRSTTSTAQWESGGSTENEARQKAEAEAKARAELQAKEKALYEAEETEAKEKAEGEAREKATREARERERKEAVERERKEQVEREAKEKVERERKEQVEREAKEKVEREAKEKVERERKEQVEREAKEKVEREAKEKVERERKEQVEREAKEKVERERKETAEREATETQRKREATETPSEREAREKAEREAREKAEREAKEKAEREAREKAEREAKEKAEREAKEKAEREAKERAEREAREKLELEPVLGAVVKALPTGPPTPASGWTVQYADAFATPILGTPQAKGASVVDNTWKVQNSNNGCCSNSNEPNGMRPRQVEVTPEGLKENCVYKPEGITAEGSSSASSRVYECGGLDSAYCCHMGDGEPAGYNTPVFWTGLGQTFAFQAVLKLPPNTGLADPAFWADGPPWTESEMDFPEFYGSCPTCTAATDWTGGANAYYATFGSPHPELVKDGFTNHPDQGFHTYTFYVFPGSNTSKYRFSVYIDGELQTLNGATVSPETSSVAERIGLILDYSLRNANTSAATPAGGSYFARSAAIYEDTAHAGLGIEHGGLAPGTTVVP
jgi:hypothetical protein